MAAEDCKASLIVESQSSCLLVPDRTLIPTCHVISVLMPSETFSNAFYAVKLCSESQQKYNALCCWLNSTLGLLLILSTEVRRAMLGYDSRSLIGRFNIF